jgi:uncharacterized membrane protein
MVLSSRLSARRLLTALTLVVALVGGAAPMASAAPSPVLTAAADQPPMLLARAGAGTSSFSRGRSRARGYGYGSHRSYGYGYRRRGGGSFLHGLFVGWTLSHFFGVGGGIPLFPLLFFLFILWAMFRGGGGRRRAPRRGGPWQQF